MTTTSLLLHPQNLRNQLRQIGQLAVDVLFPPRCVACEAIGAHLCAACAQQVEPVTPPYCSRCGRPQNRAQSLCSHCQEVDVHPLAVARAAALFTHPLRSAIHGLKYENRPELAVPLARYLTATYQAEKPNAWPDPINRVVPVPLHAQRLQERGYNQAEQLARAFCRATQLPLDGTCLRRIRMTASQVGLNVQQRQQNVADAFQVEGDVRGHTVLLIDDVFTTGATLNACARALQSAGAHAVCALTLATPAPSTGESLA